MILNLGESKWLVKFFQVNRVRADLLLVEQGLAETRSRAQALILAGVVLNQHGHRIEKAGSMLSNDTVLRLQHEVLPYVSRGGVKLKAALDYFSIKLNDKVCLDVGASTGGFTDCALKSGAKKVYALDVGMNQLAWSLRNDSRVVVLEKTNIRTCSEKLIQEGCDFLCIDVSFISLLLVLESALRFTTTRVEVVALLKPQFEVGRQEVGKGGIVREPQARQRCVEQLHRFFWMQGLRKLKCTASPILGAKGNKEFLLYGAKINSIDPREENYQKLGYGTEFYI